MPAELVARIKTALGRGDHFTAYDLAAGAGEDTPELRYLEVLALSRLGDWRGALERYAAYRLGERDDADCLAMRGRLLKDRALAAPEAERAADFLTAHAAYLAAYHHAGGSFALINAATTAALGGAEAEARRCAEAVLADPTVAMPASYWDAASAAEAHLLLGRVEAAEAAIATALTLPGADIGARASTFRQLSLIAAGRPRMPAAVLAALLGPLHPPAVVHYCGHMFADGSVGEDWLAAEIATTLDSMTVGYGYGGLACGADIVFAEQLLARGAELHVVLPFDAEDYLESSVRLGGDGWEARHAACLARATRIRQASTMNFVGDPAQYGYGGAVAMGLVKLHARQLGAEAFQLAVWDGRPARGIAGTAADIGTWTEHGGRSVVIGAGGLDRALGRPRRQEASEIAGRSLRAVVFTDFYGFSKIAEPAIPAFWSLVMEGASRALDAHAAHIVCRNTWGDALYLVFDTADSAAVALLDLRDAMAAIDGVAMGIAGTSLMRIAAHFGPVYVGRDPVTGTTNYYGTEVSLAARIEPVTPPGAVYITEPFAAMLEMSKATAAVAAYVGPVTLAKGYGVYPMYRLDRA